MVLKFKNQLNQLLMKLIKQRKASLTLYKEQNRSALAIKEEEEINIISEFLPKQMNESELIDQISEIITSEKGIINYIIAPSINKGEESFFIIILILF